MSCGGCCEPNAGDLVAVLADATPAQLALISSYIGSASLNGCDGLPLASGTNVVRCSELQERVRRVPAFSCNSGVITVFGDANTTYLVQQYHAVTTSPILTVSVSTNASGFASFNSLGGGTPTVARVLLGGFGGPVLGYVNYNQC